MRVCGKTKSATEGYEMCTAGRPSLTFVVKSPQFSYRRFVKAFAAVNEAALPTEDLRVGGILRVLLRLDVELSPFLPRSLPNAERTERVPSGSLLQPIE